MKILPKAKGLMISNKRLEFEEIGEGTFWEPDWSQIYHKMLQIIRYIVIYAKQFMMWEHSALLAYQVFVPPKTATYTFLIMDSNPWSSPILM